MVFLDNYRALARYLCRLIVKWMAEICHDIYPTKTVCAIRKCYVGYWFCELQGSVRQYSWFLSLLFLIYVNDMASSFDSNYKIILYAEDRFFFSDINPNFISKKLGAVF